MLTQTFDDVDRYRYALPVSLSEKLLNITNINCPAATTLQMTTLDRTTTHSRCGELCRVKVRLKVIKVMNGHIKIRPAMNARLHNVDLVKNCFIA